MIIPTRNNIEFEFLETTASGGFNNTTEWGFEIRNRNEDIGTPRWGVVKSIGPEVENVSVGDYILIQPLMWTEEMKHDSVSYRYTSDAKILLTSKTQPSGFH